MLINSNVNSQLKLILFTLMGSAGPVVWEIKLVVYQNRGYKLGRISTFALLIVTFRGVTSESPSAKSL